MSEENARQHVGSQPVRLMAAAATATATASKRNRAEKKPCSVFDLPADFFDSVRLLLVHNRRRQHPDALLPPLIPSSAPPSTKGSSSAGRGVGGDDAVLGDMDGAAGDKGREATATRWTCNTCKAEFESLQEQRSHFKSDFHRLNVKLRNAGKNAITEDAFDDVGGDSLFEDFDVSSISGSEDEVENETVRHVGISGGVRDTDRKKLYLSLQSGDTVSFWRCLLLNETEDASFENSRLNHMTNDNSCLEEGELIDRLKVLVREPRDKSHIRIVLLASGGHFAGCVFDGNSVIAHKTFHRYVVRAKAGKKQSTKDGTGKVAHSAGSALRRYNEAALKKEVQQLLISWKPFIDSSSCIFINAPSTSRQLLFDGEKPLLSSQGLLIRHVPFTVHRPTLKEAKRVYNHLTSMVYEVDENDDVEEDTPVTEGHKETTSQHPNEGDLSGHLDFKESSSGSVSGAECQLTTGDTLFHGDEGTPLHEAAKSGDAQRTLELLEQGFDPCIRDAKGHVPYTLATEKEVRNIFRRFMALNPDKWDWHAANVPSPLTKEMEEAQAMKQAEKDAKRKAKAKELKKQRKAKEKAKTQAAMAENASKAHPPGQGTLSASALKQPPKGNAPIRLSKEEEQRRAIEAEREKRAAAAERRIAALNASLASTTVTPPTSSEPKSGPSDAACSCCGASLAGKVPFHRFNYKYCSTSCMYVHKQMLEDE